MRLAKNCRIEYLHETLGEYNFHGTGITGNLEKHSRNTLNVIEYHFRQWPKRSIYFKYKMRKRRAAIIRSRGRVLMASGEHREAQQLLSASLKEDPFSWKTWALCSLNLVRVKV